MVVRPFIEFVAFVWYSCHLSAIYTLISGKKDTLMITLFTSHLQEAVVSRCIFQRNFLRSRRYSVAYFNIIYRHLVFLQRSCCLERPAETDIALARKSRILHFYALRRVCFSYRA